MITVSRDQAYRDKTAHTFRPGVGYIAVGKPPMPSRPRFAPPVAEPPAVAAPETWHLLQPPQGDVEIMARWHPAQREWMPAGGMGNRLAFSSEYLAAHGWKYKEPAQVS